MNMMQLTQNSGRSTSFQHIEQIESQTLHILLNQPNKTALIAKLNSQHFSQTSMQSLLYKAFLEESTELVAMMLETKSYGVSMLAHIIVNTLNNDQEENEQEKFVSVLLKAHALKVEILIKALDLVPKNEINLNHAHPLIDRLIKLGALSAEEAAQITHICPNMGEFLGPEHWNSRNCDFLANNQPVINETEVIEEAPQTATIAEGLFSTIPDEIITEIGHFLELKDLLRYGQTSRGFSEAIQTTLQNYTYFAQVDELTDGAMVTFGKLRCLDLSLFAATDGNLQRISQLTNLRSLNLACAEVTTDDLRGLKKLTNLHNLKLNNTKTSDAGIRHLRKLTNLHTLNLNDTKTSDAGIRHLRKLINLRTLKLHETKVSSAGLRHVKKLTNLHTLDLSCIELTNDGLLHLEKLTNLHTLDLAAGEIDNWGLSQLVNKLIHLHTLDLTATDVTDAGLPHLAKLIHLHTLELSSTEVTDAGLPHLAKLTHLHTLDLADTKVTDAGLHHLENLTQLHTLDLSRTKVTTGKRQYLREILPNLKTLHL